MQEVEILMKNAEADYIRFKILLENEAVTRQQFEDVQTKYESLKAKLETMKRQKRSTHLTKMEQTQRLEQNEAAYRSGTSRTGINRIEPVIYRRAGTVQRHDVAQKRSGRRIGDAGRSFFRH